MGYELSPSLLQRRGRADFSRPLGLGIGWAPPADGSPRSRGGTKSSKAIGLAQWGGSLASHLMLAWRRDQQWRCAGAMECHQVYRGFAPLQQDRKSLPAELVTATGSGLSAVTGAASAPPVSAQRTAFWFT